MYVSTWFLWPGGKHVFDSVYNEEEKAIANHLLFLYMQFQTISPIHYNSSQNTDNNHP